MESSWFKKSRCIFPNLMKSKCQRKVQDHPGRIVFLCLAGTQAKISTNNLNNQGALFPYMITTSTCFTWCPPFKGRDIRINSIMTSLLVKPLLWILIRIGWLVESRTWADAILVVGRFDSSCPTRRSNHRTVENHVHYQNAFSTMILTQ